MVSMDDDYCRPSEIAVSITFLIWSVLTGWAYARPSFVPSVVWDAGQDPLPDLGSIVFFVLGAKCALVLAAVAIGRFDQIRPWTRAIGLVPVLFQPVILIQKLFG
jgi:hypothetical protein